MKKFLFILMFFCTSAFADYTFTINNGCSNGTWNIVSQSSTNLVVSCVPTTVASPPVVTIPTVPTVDLCKNYSRINLGDLKADGVPLNSADMSGSMIAYGKIVVPTNAPMWAKSSVTVYANGNATAWRQINLSKTPCDFNGKAPNLVQGITATATMVIGKADPFAVTVQPGEVWYVNIRNTLPTGSNSCGPGFNCAFGLRTYPWN